MVMVVAVVVNRLTKLGWRGIVLTVNVPSATPITDTVTVYLTPESKLPKSASLGWFWGTSLLLTRPASVDKRTTYGLVVPLTSPQVTRMVSVVTLLRMTSAGTAAVVEKKLVLRPLFVILGLSEMLRVLKKYSVAGSRFSTTKFSGWLRLMRNGEEGSPFFGR